ncbi:MAG: vWA domain-containing protein, partial [Peptococcus niger]
MKQKGKKILSLLLALALLVSLMPLQAKAADGDPVSTATFKTADGHLTVQSTLTPQAGELNKYHVKRVITGTPYPKKTEVVIAVDVSKAMYEKVPGYDSGTEYSNYVTYVKDAVSEALNVNGRAKDGNYFKDLDVYVVPYEGHGRDLGDQVGTSVKKKLTFSDLTTIFALSPNEVKDKKAKIPENASKDTKYNNISSALKKSIEILTDPNRSSAVADKHVVVVTNDSANRGVQVIGKKKLKDGLTKQGLTLADVVQDNSAAGIQEIKVHDTEQPYLFDELEDNNPYEMLQGVEDSRFVQVYFNQDFSEANTEYPNGLYLNMANVIKSEANVAKYKDITIHAIGLKTDANKNNKEFANYLEKANSNTLKKPTLVTDYTSVDPLKDQIKAVLDAKSADQTNPMEKGGNLTEKIKPGFQLVPGSVKVNGVTGDAVSEDYTLTTNRDKYDGRKTTNINLDIKKLPQVNDSCQLTLEYDIVADDNLVQDSVVKEEQGYLISTYAFKYNNPSTNLEEKDNSTKSPLYANPTILELTKKRIDQSENEIKSNPDGHDYAVEISSGKLLTKTYKVPAGQTVKTTLRDKDILTQDSTVPAGQYKIQEKLLKKDSDDPLTKANGGDPITAESLYEVTYSHSYKDTETDEEKTEKLDGGVFDLPMGTQDYPLTITNKEANIGQLTVNLAMKDHQDDKIKASNKTFKVKITGTNGDKTVFPYIKPGATEAEKSEFDIKLGGEPVTIDKLPLGTYRVTISDPDTQEGFKLKDADPVVLSFDKLQGDKVSGEATVTAKIATQPYEITKKWGLDSKPDTFPTGLAAQVYGQIGTNEPSLLADPNKKDTVAFVATGHETMTGKAVFTLPKVDVDGEFYKYSFKEVGEAQGKVSLAGKNYTVKYDLDEQTITNTLIPEEYSLTFKAGEGQIKDQTPANGADGKYKENTEVSFKVAPPQGKEVAEVKAGDKALTADENGAYKVTITGDTTVTVTYKAAPTPQPGQEDKYLVTVEPEGAVAIDNPTADKKYAKDSKVTFAVKAKEGKKVTSVT